MKQMGTRRLKYYIEDHLGITTVVRGLNLDFVRVPQKW